MNGLSYAMAAFVLFDLLRIAGFFLQMDSIRRDRHGAMAVSCASWATSASSHFSTAVYGAFYACDWRLASMFAFNGACCLVVIAMTCAKRRQFRTRGCVRAMPTAMEER